MRSDHFRALDVQPGDILLTRIRGREGQLRVESVEVNGPRGFCIHGEWITGIGSTREDRGTIIGAGIVVERLVKANRVVFPAEPPPPAPQAEHFFASTFAAWFTARTREVAIAGAVRRTGKTLVDAQKRDGGIEVLSCRVPLPLDAPYAIQSYLPAGDTGRTDVEKHRVPGWLATPVLVPAEEA